MSHQYDRGDSLLLKKLSHLVLGEQRILSTTFLLVEDNILTIYKNYIKENNHNKNNEYNKKIVIIMIVTYEDKNKAMYMKHIKNMLL